MHIPDGYLSPETCGTLGAAMVPVWTVAARRVRKVVKSRYVPLLAVGAAYCFLIMMFNIPIPDGTTAHAAGAVLVAVLLGPEAAVIAVSVALAIQALFFGDGGVLAFGANAFNMAFVMPLTGYAVYRLVSRGTSLTSRRRALAAGLGGYVGLNAAALCAAIEFGLQPTLFHRADGTPLYAPFHLSHTIPAMMLAHLLVAGVIEAVLTAGVVSYLQRANVPLLRINHKAVAESDDDLPPPTRLRWRWAVVGLGVMALLTPLGLIAPGTAFGEDAPQDLDLRKYHLDAVPEGLRRYAGFWHHTLFDGYGFRNDANPTVGYLVSAFVGIAVIVLAIAAFFGLRRLVRRVSSA
ncbi:MAG TPA: cobalt transporter CbiM [Acidimicrobiales bacterium]|nr:cobalt transporter CbiM [Acidimicrobiales bacterium]